MSWNLIKELEAKVKELDELADTNGKVAVQALTKVKELENKYSVMVALAAQSNDENEKLKEVLKVIATNPHADGLCIARKALGEK